MNNMVISIYLDEAKAEEARRHLLASEKQKSLDLEDTLIMKKTGEGEVKLRYIKRATLSGAVMGAFWGSLAGILFLNPLFAIAGFFIGFFIGIISGRLTHLGVNIELARSEAESMAPGSSALCALSRGSVDGVLNEIQAFNGDVVETRVCTQKGGVRSCSLLPRLRHA